ncbi:MAG: DUF6078 family protein [Bacteroides sp.]|nr:DUF6078 family protein [Bacteroides sp.]
MQLEDIPHNYTYCYATAEQCSQASLCLRYHAARLNEEQDAPRSALSCVTPAYVAKVSAGTACKYFRDSTRLQYARGMQHLFDAVPRSQWMRVRNDVMRVFSCERRFYYAQKGEQLITPAEQKRIKTIFANAGLSAPAFDHYEMKPDWTA